MKKALLFFCVLIFSVAVSAQKGSLESKRYPFVRYHNTNIEKHMKEGRYLTLHLYTDSGSVFIYSGRIFVCDTNSLLMRGGMIEYHGYTDGGITYEQRITSNPDNEITVVPHKEIEYISLVPRARPVFGALILASLVPIFVFVPLASVGYTSKNFNSGEVVEIAAASLVVNVSLYKIFSVRKFRIKGAAIGGKS